MIKGRLPGRRRGLVAPDRELVLPSLDMALSCLPAGSAPVVHTDGGLLQGREVEGPVRARRRDQVDVAQGDLPGQ